MTRTIASDIIGTTNIGYAIVAIPSEAMKNKIGTLLEDLSRNLPGVLWTMPPEQLHVTLCEIIQPKPYTQDKDELYNELKDEYEAKLSTIFSMLSPFTVTFDTIDASDQAVIIKASDSSGLNVIRSQIVSSIQLPNETRTPPDITHSSVARYLQAADLKEVQGVVSTHTFNIEEEIACFKLLRTTKLPLEEYDVLAEYNLRTKAK